MRAIISCATVALIVSCSWPQEAPEAGQVRALVIADCLDEALALAQDWTLRAPADPEALIIYANLQAQAGLFDGAIESLEAAHFLTRDPALLVEQGLVYLHWGRAEQAEQTMLQALHHSDICAAAHAGLARVMLELGRPIEARAAAQAALKIEPYCAPAQVVLARLEVQNGQLDQATRILQETRASTKVDAEVALWLGNLLALQGRIDEAREQWCDYITQVPGSTAGWLLTQGLHPLDGSVYPCPGAYPVLSPDGSQVAYRGNEDPGTVYLAPGDHPEQSHAVYRSQSNIFSLDWSPDGSLLACREYNKTEVAGKPQARYAIVILVIGDQITSRVIYSGSYVGECCFTSDGHEVWFDGYLPGQGRGILSIPVIGGEPRLALQPQRQETFIGCRFSPAQGRLLVQRWQQQAREYQLLLMNPADRQHDEIIVRTPQKLQAPVFTPDGTHLFYLLRVPGGSWDLVVQSVASGSRPRVLFRGMRSLVPVTFAPAQRLMLACDAAGQLRLYTLMGLR